METRFDVVGIGNALVDVLSHEDESFVAAQGLVKGSMNLIDSDRALALYDAMGPGIEISGGSAANTMVGVASFGGQAVYIGRVRDDQLGVVFAHDLRSTGVDYEVPAAADGPATGRCLILITPDAQRTMNTYLGASNELKVADVDLDLVCAGKALYLEGYLWDPPEAKEAMRIAARAARDAGRVVSLTLSDSFAVDRHRDSFRDLIASDVDLLFANQDEAMSLYEVDDIETAISEAAANVEIAAVTRGRAGSVIVANGERHDIAAVEIEKRVDTTGAGDLYAAGFLFGLTHGYDLPVAGRLASAAASEVISHVGARPEIPLESLLEEIVGAV